MDKSTHGQVDSLTTRLIVIIHVRGIFFFFFFLFNLFIYIYFKSLNLMFSDAEGSVESSRRNKRVTHQFIPARAGPGLSSSAVSDHTDVSEWRHQSNFIIFVDCSFWPCWPTFEDVKEHYYFTIYFTDFVLVNFLLLSIRPINILSNDIIITIVFNHL